VPTPKKVAETDAIFAQLAAVHAVAAVHAAAAADPTVLRISADAKAPVSVGPYSRRGYSRVPVRAADHDLQPEATITPVGLFLPGTDELFLYGITSKVASDCLVDCLEHWWQEHGCLLPAVRTLLLNLDNGPECHSRRTQFMHRLLAFAQRTGLTLQRAYYPPYHSKYNPVERCWGVLEQHWNGSLLESVDAVLQFAASMTWKGRARRHPQLYRLPNRRSVNESGDGGGGSATPASLPTRQVVCHDPWITHYLMG
jgi:hypothetical protein